MLISLVVGIAAIVVGLSLLLRARLDPGRAAWLALAPIIKGDASPYGVTGSFRGKEVRFEVSNITSQRIGMTSAAEVIPMTLGAWRMTAVAQGLMSRASWLVEAGRGHGPAPLGMQEQRQELDVTSISYNGHNGLVTIERVLPKSQLLGTGDLAKPPVPSEADFRAIITAAAEISVATDAIPETDDIDSERLRASGQ